MDGQDPCGVGEVRLFAFQARPAFIIGAHPAVEQQDAVFEYLARVSHSDASLPFLLWYQFSGFGANVKRLLHKRRIYAIFVSTP